MNKTATEVVLELVASSIQKEAAIGRAIGGAIAEGIAQGARKLKYPHKRRSLRRHEQMVRQSLIRPNQEFVKLKDIMPITEYKVPYGLRPLADRYHKVNNGMFNLTGLTPSDLIRGPVNIPMKPVPNPGRSISFPELFDVPEKYL